MKDGVDDGVDDSGEPSPVWQMGKNEGDRRSDDIQQADKGDGNNGANTNPRVDIPYKVAEPREKEEEGHMQATRNCFCNIGYVSALQSIVQVLTKSCTLQRVVVSLADLHVIAHPLLHEDC